MSEPENPFNRTIWDPVDPEHAIEDTLHGPTAVHRQLQVPPMPRGDGTYYQAGGFYTLGSVYLDALDRPLDEIGVARSTTPLIREALAFAEWRLANIEGEAAATALEARRQQERLERYGVAYAFKPSDVCAGGQRLEDCQTAGPMVDAAREWADRIGEEGMEAKGACGISRRNLARLAHLVLCFAR
jgi:hypothetical protein